MLEKIHRLFISYEKEENWLNKMSSMGMMLSHYTWGTYYFEKGIPGEYIYRIELLPELPNHPESKAYIDFLEETGVECVSTYLRWVYFRKKTSDGPFDLYSDIDSKISHYKRILSLFSVAWFINLFAAILNISIVAASINYIPHMNGICAVISTSITILLGILCLSYIKKIKKLKKLKLLNE